MTTQQGTAIVVALFVTALVAAMSVAMLLHLRTDTRRTELMLNHIRATLLTEGSVAWARETLRNHLKREQPGRITDPTPIDSPVDHMQGATIKATIEDAEGRLNLNNLTDPDFQVVFLRLLQGVYPTLTEAQAKQLEEAVIDWITPGLQNTPFDQYYAKRHPPMQAPHRPMASVSELRMVKGMNAALYSALLPTVFALPHKTRININNAPLELLMVLSPKMTREQALRFIQTRKHSPLTDLSGNTPLLQDSLINKKILSVQSQYFLVKSEVVTGDQREVVYTLLQRTRKDNEPFTGILWQSKGTL